MSDPTVDFPITRMWQHDSGLLHEERLRNAILLSALSELVEAIDANSGYEPSKSVYDRALDEAREILAGRMPTR